jgi:thiosulfate dehydrogenase
MHKVPAPRLSLAAAAIAVTFSFAVAQNAQQEAPVRTVPEVGALPQDSHGQLVRRGRDLITATYAYIGPGVAPDRRYAGNNLACSNCHLSAGTRKFGLPLFGLFADFPEYNPRSGGDITIEQRIDG